MSITVKIDRDKLVKTTTTTESEEFPVFREIYKLPFKSGDRIIGAIIQPLRDSITSISTTTYTTYGSIHIPIDFKPSGMRLILAFAMDMKDDGTGQVCVNFKDTDSGDSVAEICSDQSGADKVFYKEVDVTDWTGWRKIQIQYKVTAGTGDIYKDSTIVLIYEVI